MRPKLANKRKNGEVAASDRVATRLSHINIIQYPVLVGKTTTEAPDGETRCGQNSSIKRRMEK